MTRFFRDPRTYGTDPSANAAAGALGMDIGRFMASAPQPPRAGMFGRRTPATRVAITENAHSPAELARERQACLSPMFQEILGAPAVERQRREAMSSAIATPNLRPDHEHPYDIPANGSEYGFQAAYFPIVGVNTGPTTTTRREHEDDVNPGDAPLAASLLTPRDLTFIHVHQSPAGLPGLSGADLKLADSTSAGPGMNIVAIDGDGKRYCKAARR